MTLLYVNLNTSVEATEVTEMSFDLTGGRHPPGIRTRVFRLNF